MSRLHGNHPESAYSLALCAFVLLSQACNIPLRAPRGTTIVLAPSSAAIVTAESLRSAQTVLQKRLDTVLTGQASIEIADSTLRVTLTKADEITRTVELAAEIGAVVFFDSDVPLEPNAAVPAKVQPILSNRDIAHAEAIFNPTTNTWGIGIAFSSSGTDILAQYTAANVGHYLVIARDNSILSAPRIQSAISDGKAMIAGNFDKVAAEALAAQLTSGYLPYALVPIEED